MLNHRECIVVSLSTLKSFVIGCNSILNVGLLLCANAPEWMLHCPNYHNFNIPHFLFYYYFYFHYISKQFDESREKKSHFFLSMVVQKNLGACQPFILKKKKNRNYLFGFYIRLQKFTKPKSNCFHIGI